MNDTARRIVMDRMRRGDRRGGRDYGDYYSERYNDRRGDYYGERYNDRRGGYYGDMKRDRRGDYEGDYLGSMEYRGEVEYDRGRKKSERNHEEEETKLSKSELKQWKKMLQNSDGSMGEHFTEEHLVEAARQIGVRFDKYDEAELCMTANMLYSDLGEALRSVVPKEKEPIIYAKMARHWLEDDDGPEGSEKLALYFWCIVEDED